MQKAFLRGGSQPGVAPGILLAIVMECLAFGSVTRRPVTKGGPVSKAVWAAGVQRGSLVFPVG